VASIRFERGALVAVCALAVGLIVAVVASPLDRATAAPKASLRLAVSALLPPPAMAPARKPHKRSMAASGAGIDTITGMFSVLLPPQPYWTQLPPETTVETLSETFRELGYDLQRVRDGAATVPRLFLASLPGDLKDVREVTERKSLFFKTVLPLVLQVNEEILRDRRRLWKIHYQMSLGERLAAADRLWLTVMAERYALERGDIQGLLDRVDVIPPSMALAQAAEESGWGTSRFVQEGNAVFGQWTYSDTGSLVPLRRGEDKNHKVKAFSTLHESVRAYAMNLNTHRAYERFREVRASLRTEGAPLDGYLLADNLTSYSERGERYVRTIKLLIEVNRLRHLDDARLGDDDFAPSPFI
jgi:Bax protein